MSNEIKQREQEMLRMVRSQTNYFWKPSEDMREALRLQIEWVLKQRPEASRPERWLERVPQLVIVLEEDLFSHAQNANEYNDLNTLKKRLRDSAKRLKH
jgi:hypothetical protein